MGYGLVDNNTLTNIADAIRFKTNSNANYYPRDMALAINQIETGGNGFSTPVVQSVLPWATADISWSNITYNFQNNGLINTVNMRSFEFSNTIDNNANYLAKVDWEGRSKGNVYLYEKDNKNIYGLYVDGNHLPNDISILDMTGLFFNARNYTGNAFCTPLTTILDGTFSGQQNIIGNAACGDYVTSMRYAYYGCSNITNAICGPYVRYFQAAYSSCSNILHGVCGNNVVNMYGAYGGCTNLVDLEIGANVKDIQYVASSCRNIVNITGDANNVEKANYAFYGCYNANINSLPRMTSLKYSEYMFYECNNFSNDILSEFSNRSRNIIDANYMYHNCFLLEEAYIWDNLVNAYFMFNCCNNLREVIGTSSNLQNVTYMFYNCYALEEPLNLIGTNVNSMNAMYRNCYNLKNCIIGENVASMSYTFENCYNISGDIEIPNKVSMIGYAFYRCDNVGNVVLFNNVIGNTPWQQVNAFYRTNYSTRRNIVLTNRSAYNNFLYCNCAGNWTKSYDNSTVTEVTVNGKNYNCVRCAYNISYNCYVYCTE